MVGNKTDLLGEVPEKDAKNFANEIGAIFTTTSAKISNGIDEIFKTIAKTIALLHPPDKNTAIKLPPKAEYIRIKASPC